MTDTDRGEQSEYNGDIASLSSWTGLSDDSLESVNENRLGTPYISWSDHLDQFLPNNSLSPSSFDLYLPPSSKSSSSSSLAEAQGLFEDQEPRTKESVHKALSYIEFIAQEIRYDLLTQEKGEVGYLKDFVCRVEIMHSGHYSIDTLLNLGKALKGRVDFSKFSKDAQETVLKTQSGSGNTTSLVDSSAGLQQTSNTSRSKIPLLVPAGSVLLGPSSDTVITTFDNSNEGDGSSSTQQPLRQSFNPPYASKAQEDAGFARFLREVASPTHHRVTAGGKIVPMGPPPPRPNFTNNATFNMSAQAQMNLMNHIARNWPMELLKGQLNPACVAMEALQGQLDVLQGQLNAACVSTGVPVGTGPMLGLTNANGHAQAIAPPVRHCADISELPPGTRVVRDGSLVIFEGKRYRVSMIPGTHPIYEPIYEDEYPPQVVIDFPTSVQVPLAQGPSGFQQPHYLPTTQMNPAQVQVIPNQPAPLKDITNDVVGIQPQPSIHEQHRALNEHMRGLEYQLNQLDRHDAIYRDQMTPSSRAAMIAQRRQFVCQMDEVRKSKEQLEKYDQYQATFREEQSKQARLKRANGRNVADQQGKPHQENRPIWGEGWPYEGYEYIAIPAARNVAQGSQVVAPHPFNQGQVQGSYGSQLALSQHEVRTPQPVSNLRVTAPPFHPTGLAHSPKTGNIHGQANHGKNVIDEQSLKIMHQSSNIQYHTTENKPSGIVSVEKHQEYRKPAVADWTEFPENDDGDDAAWIPDDSKGSATYARDSGKIVESNVVQPDEWHAQEVSSTEHMKMAQATVASPYSAEPSSGADQQTTPATTPQTIGRHEYGHLSPRELEEATEDAVIGDLAVPGSTMAKLSTENLSNLARETGIEITELRHAKLGSIYATSDVAIISQREFLHEMLSDIRYRRKGGTVAKFKKLVDREISKNQSISSQAKQGTLRPIRNQTGSSARQGQPWNPTSNQDARQQYGNKAGYSIARSSAQAHGYFPQYDGAVDSFASTSGIDIDRPASPKKTGEVTDNTKIDASLDAKTLIPVATQSNDDPINHEAGRAASPMKTDTASFKTQKDGSTDTDTKIALNSEPGSEGEAKKDKTYWTRPLGRDATEMERRHHDHVTRFFEKLRAAEREEMRAYERK